MSLVGVKNNACMVCTLMDMSFFFVGEMFFVGEAAFLLLEKHFVCWRSSFFVVGETICLLEKRRLFWLEKRFFGGGSGSIL